MGESVMFAGRIQRFHRCLIDMAQPLKQAGIDDVFAIIQRDLNISVYRIVNGFIFVFNRHG